jgi:hypothetical protein
VPLTGGSFAQETNESDLTVFAEVNVTHPSACGEGGAGYLDLYVDGAYRQTATFAAPGESRVTRALDYAGFLLMPAGGAHTVTAKARDTGCADPSSHLTIHRLRLDVIGFR